MFTIRSTRRRRTGVALSLAAGLVLAGCSTDVSDATGTPAAEADDAMSDDAKPDDAMTDEEKTDDAMTEEGESGAMANPALDFAAQDLDGNDVDLAAISGPVVLWFWAPWCPNCRAEAPDVAAVAAETDVTIIGVSGRDEADAMRAFVAETGTDGFQHLADLDGSIWQRFSVASQPAFAFIDAKGETDVVLGGLGADALRSRIADLTS